MLWSFSYKYRSDCVSINTYSIPYFYPLIKSCNLRHFKVVTPNLISIKLDPKKDNVENLRIAKQKLNLSLNIINLQVDKN